MHKFKITKGSRYMGHIEAENYSLALAAARMTYGEFWLKAHYVVPSCE